MGIVNVTPDSFSDGGEHLAPDAAVAHALKLLDEGADVVDIGGESTRPGARVGAENPAVSAEVELQRVLPVITGVKKARPSAIVSIDTYKSTVARDAVEAGAEIVNDVSGLQWDPAMKATLAGLTCGVVLMHTRGRPDEWRSLPTVLDMVMLTNRELRQRSDAAVAGGVKRDRIVLDPGFGFGKRFEENYPLLRRFSEFQELRFPLLAGVSKKSFVGRALAQNGKDATVAGRQFGSLGAEVALAMKGAHIIRTHDVRMCVEALRLADLAAS
ncbi:MAG: dihydropteroate synthase [Acidobacteria bacterium]|nr:MAG: dihydropteroate synthase [Acidobacteriota bacterium]